ncbi:MAG: hypothetical protein WBR15_09210 [Gammaproteobacteria bacterium]
MCLVLEIRNDWRHVRLRLPFTAFSRNLSGDVFGGWQVALQEAAICSEPKQLDLNRV